MTCICVNFDKQGGIFVGADSRVTAGNHISTDNPHKVVLLHGGTALVAASGYLGTCRLVAKEARDLVEQYTTRSYGDESLMWARCLQDLADKLREIPLNEDDRNSLEVLFAIPRIGAYILDGYGAIWEPAQHGAAIGSATAEATGILWTGWKNDRNPLHTLQDALRGAAELNHTVGPPFYYFAAAGRAEAFTGVTPVDAAGPTR